MVETDSNPARQSQETGTWAVLLMGLVQGLFWVVKLRKAGIFLCCFALLTTATAIADEPKVTEDTDEMSALDRRIQIERKTRYQSFVLTPHKPNYILPIAYNSNPNNAPVDTSREGELDKLEVKFQFSVKFPIIENLFGEQGSIQFAYTNRSFWQAYNASASYPFRETVHEPELFLIFENDWHFLGMDNRLIQLGIVHQSNGQTGNRSRTWNRVYIDLIFQRGDFYLSVKPWYHLKETGSAKDDNPDIEDYYGHGELRVAYAGGKHTASIMLRNNFDDPNYGALEVNWSYPMTRRVKLFVQYFNGYGESLIDYNARVNRLGIGVAFTDWL